MGTWGYNLYDDDIALDVRDQFLELISRGESATSATNKIIAQNQDIISDSDEAPIFWFVLADIQWENGILDDQVKENAISCIDSGENFKRWKESSPENLKSREKVLKELKEKLLSPLPEIKKKTQIKKHSRCEWNLGDTFAYPLLTDYAKEKGLYGEYFVFYKVGETEFDRCIVPVVWVKITKGGKLPSSEAELDALEFVQTSVTKFENRFFPFHSSQSIEEQIIEKSKKHYERDEFGHLPQFRQILLNTSKRAIPKSLVYLGNFANIHPPKCEYIPEIDLHIPSLNWKFFEEIMIDRYIAFNLRQSPLYQR